MARFRYACALVALVLPLLLSGCGPVRVHIRIPDFNYKGVDGLLVYRVGADGRLLNAGYIKFGAIILTKDGLQMQYTQYAADNTKWGPLMAPVEQPFRGQIDLELTFVNGGTPSYFRFASYNEFGISRPSAKQLFVGG